MMLNLGEDKFWLLFLYSIIAQEQRTWHSIACKHATSFQLLRGSMESIYVVVVLRCSLSAHLKKHICVHLIHYTLRHSYTLDLVLNAHTCCTVLYLTLSTGHHTSHWIACTCVCTCHQIKIKLKSIQELEVFILVTRYNLLTLH